MNIKISTSHTFSFKSISQKRRVAINTYLPIFLSFWFRNYLYDLSIEYAHIKIIKDRSYPVLYLRSYIKLWKKLLIKLVPYILDSLEYLRKINLSLYSWYKLTIDLETICKVCAWSNSTNLKLYPIKNLSNWY